MSVPAGAGCARFPEGMPARSAVYCAGVRQVLRCCRDARQAVRRKSWNWVRPLRRKGELNRDHVTAGSLNGVCVEPLPVPELNKLRLASGWSNGG
jgi:hypothetical protein